MEKVNEVTNESTVNGGTLEVFELSMPQFEDGRKRKIRVWLPKEYNPRNKCVRYPVLYMHDGQNLFDKATSFEEEWQVDESLTALFNEGYEKTIVVGIDNGELERFRELSPEWELSDLGKQYFDNPVGSKYAEFIMETVKPLIDQKYNTKPDRRNTGIGGSSMGGVMSLYMAIKYADRIGYGLLLSTAMLVYGQDVLDKFLAENTITKKPYLYIYSGGWLGDAPAGSVWDETLFTQYVEKIKTSLLNAGFPCNHLKTMIDMDNYHNEISWRKVFPVAYQWCMDHKNHFHLCTNDEV